ncbi:MAG TPA: hypothetical protein DD377_04365 [Firmicutes bacterium]|nr:hypothetical protein [Bacillota bacterium]
MENKVLTFIKTHWEKTVQPAREDVPFPFNSPCENSFYTDFFYWDLYFINKGLLATNLSKQAENNLDDMAYFVNKIGYVPNSNGLLNRSQPPVFTLCVYDLYLFKKDINVIKKYIDVLLKEHDFFMKKRMTPIGLNSFGDSASDKEIMEHYFMHCDRVKEYSRDPKKQYVIGKDIIAIAESGLDFNMRFKTKESKIAAHEFAHLDLNCWLYLVETRLEEMLLLIDRKEEGNEFNNLRKERKEKINKYFFNEKEGLYLDYNYINNTFSKVLTCVSLYPFAFGISRDRESALKVLNKLEYEHGVSCAEYRGEDIYYQWDYPIMWGEVSLIVYAALKNVGADKEAKRVKDKYMATIETNFEKTGKLWEKYDSRTGEISNVEYASPAFMGWTAASYQLFAQGNDIVFGK